MKPLLTTIALALVSTATLPANIIPVDLGPPRWVHGQETIVTYPQQFALSGQQVTLTFTFSSGVRVFSPRFYLVVNFQSNSLDVLDWTPMQFSLLDKDGKTEETGHV